MRIATWNINGLRARLDFLLHWLEARQPDLVGIQELKLADEQFPQLELQAAGYRAVSHGQRSWNGVAVLSREPVELRQSGLPGQHHMGARLLSTQVGNLSFVTVYCPNGKDTRHEDFPMKLAWLEALVDHVRERYRPENELVICGDFNLCPAPLDSWNEEANRGELFHTDAERELFHRLLDWGLIDLFRNSHPELQKFSWWDYRAGAFHKNHGLRIDFLLSTPAIAGRVRNVEIDREYRKKKDGLIASDHAPVWADLD